MRDGLAAIVGRDHVADDPASVLAYASDTSFAAAIEPQAVVRPGSADEVKALVAWANETASPLVPVSSGAPHFLGDTVPSVRGATIVDLSRMDAILRIDRRNRACVIEPGVTFAKVQAALAAEGMRITPPLAPRAGKSVVASLLERQPTLIPRYNYHLPEPLRDCGVVWGSGDVMYTGEAGSGPLSLERQWRAGNVQIEPKGPAQTDFFRLLTGAQGTMGIVTWASVKCELRATARKLCFVPAASLEQLIDLVYGVNRVRLGDEVLLVDAAYLARLLAANGATAVAPAALVAELPVWTLIVGLGGREHYAAERVAVAEKDLRVLAELQRLEVRESLGGVSAGAVEAAIGSSLAGPWKLAAAGASADIFFLCTLDKAAGHLATARAAAAASGLAAADVGVYIQPQHQGVSQHVEISLPYDPDDPAQTARAQRFFDAASARLIAEGAYFSRPYGSWAQPVYARDPASAAALRKVKKIFDPNNVMNPGKLCFGAPDRKEA